MNRKVGVATLFGLASVGLGGCVDPMPKLPPVQSVCAPVVPAFDQDRGHVRFNEWAGEDLDYQSQPGGYGAWVNRFGAYRGFAEQEDSEIYEQVDCILEGR